MIVVYFRSFFASKLLKVGLSGEEDQDSEAR